MSSQGAEQILLLLLDAGGWENFSTPLAYVQNDQRVIGIILRCVFVFWVPPPPPRQFQPPSPPPKHSKGADLGAHGWGGGLKNGLQSPPPPHAPIFLPALLPQPQCCVRSDLQPLACGDNAVDGL